MPPPGFAGTEYGTYGERTYARTLCEGEAAMVSTWAVPDPDPDR